MYWRTTAVAIAIAIATLPITACASAVAGNPTATATYPVGNYDTVPRDLGTAADIRSARALEGRRLADHVLLPAEIDPSLTRSMLRTGRHVILDSAALGDVLINDTFDTVAADLTAGFVTRGQTELGGPGGLMLNAVMLFPDDATATRVARELEHDDFTFSSDNVALQIGKYPAAHAHWRPGIPNAGSWYASGRFVLFTAVQVPGSESDAGRLVAQIETVLDRQLPRLADFIPTPDAELERLPADPGGLLGRTLVAEDNIGPHKDDAGVYTPHAALNFFGYLPQLTELMNNAGIDRVAIGDTQVFRARDAESAAQFAQAALAAGGGELAVDPPDGLAGSVFCAGSASTGGELYECYVVGGRTVGYVFNSSLQDLLQQASAQYVLLASE